MPPDEAPLEPPEDDPDPELPPEEPPLDVPPLEPPEDDPDPELLPDELPLDVPPLEDDPDPELPPDEPPLEDTRVDDPWPPPDAAVCAGVRVTMVPLTVRSVRDAPLVDEGALFAAESELLPPQPDSPVSVSASRLSTTIARPRAKFMWLRLDVDCRFAALDLSSRAVFKP